MTDQTQLTREELEARWRKNREEEAVRQAEKEKATKPLFMKMCEILLEAKVHFVNVEYDGQGDSGCIESVEYLDENEEPQKLLVFPQTDIAKIPIHLLPGWKEFKSYESADGVMTRQEVDGTIEDFIEDFVYGKLPGGWEINEGSFGTFKIDLKEKSWDGSRLVRTYAEEESGMSGSYED